MFFEKRGLIFGFIILLLSFIFISAATIDDETTDSGSPEGEEKTFEVPVSDPENIPNAVYTPQTNEEEASLDVTEVEEAVAVDNYQGQLTGDGWGASARYSNAIFDKNGIYQATITGIAAGASYYIISTAGDHVLRYTASEEESSVRKIVINAGAETWITVIMEEGDTIESGESKTELPYIFTAEENKATYSFAEGAMIETEQGNFAYDGSFHEDFEVTEKVQTALTAQGFYNVTLSPETEYRYIYDTLNLSLENTDERKEISICKGLVEEMTCDVQNKGNAFTITGENKILKQQGYPILESYDANNIIDINFAEETITLSNINPEEDILALFRTGYFEITETQDDTKARALLNEYPMLFRSYDSDKPYPGWILDDTNAFVYEDEDSDVKILPTEELYIETCVAAIQKKIRGESESVPAFC